MPGQRCPADETAFGVENVMDIRLAVGRLFPYLNEDPPEIVDEQTPEGRGVFRIEISGMAGSSHSKWGDEVLVSFRRPIATRFLTRSMDTILDNVLNRLNG